ncbi:MAG TPA: cytochrome c biogenesis protein CcdC [Terracidiphilus sp.]|jgi:membrane protein CcdC involved in cytochrome C biogenesis
MVAVSLMPAFFAKAAGSVLAAGAGAVVVIMWRLREARTAVSMRKIIIPPLGMATGFSMFLDPAFRVPWAWAGGAFLIGAVALAWPLLLTTRLEMQGDTVRMKRSSAFLVVILVLAAIRLFARGYFDKILTTQQTAGIFFILAFGMILIWRTKMLVDFRRLTEGLETSAG